MCRCGRADFVSATHSHATCSLLTPWHIVIFQQHSLATCRCQSSFYKRQHYLQGDLSLRQPACLRDFVLCIVLLVRFTLRGRPNISWTLLALTAWLSVTAIVCCLSNPKVWNSIPFQCLLQFSISRVFKHNLKTFYFQSLFRAEPHLIHLATVDSCFHIWPRARCKLSHAYHSCICIRCLITLCSLLPLFFCCKLLLSSCLQWIWCWLPVKILAQHETLTHWMQRSVFTANYSSEISN